MAKAGGGFLRQLADNPATKELLSNAGRFASAKAATSAGNLTERLIGGGEGGRKAGAAGGAVEEVLKDKGQGKKGGAWSAIKGAVKGFFGKGGGAKRPTNIYDYFFIGVPVEIAYREWKHYTEFPKFMKGPESVSEQDDEGKTKWTAKIFINRRSWTATVVEDIENYKIRWESEAPKGTIDGTVTFGAVDENMTVMVYALQYRPKGFFEWWGNRWRTVGRRARLDAKHFGRYVMNTPLDELEEKAEEEKEAEGDGEETPVEPEPEAPSDQEAEAEPEPEPEEETEDTEAETEEPAPAPRKSREPRRV